MRTLACRMLPFLTVALVCTVFGAVRVRAEWQPDEFLIMVGWPDLSTPGMLPALRDAGVNTVMGPADRLDDCRRNGLKLLVMKADPEIASAVRGHPALWGYDILDEPESDRFAELAEAARAIRAADPEHPPYINLMARSGDYIDEFIRTVDPSLLSYDFYQWWYGPYNEWWDGCRGHFARLEQHRDAALGAGIPLMFWVEVTANPDDSRYRHGKEDVPVPPDNMVKLRQSVYTGLAYGVKGVQWFVGRMMFRAGSAELNEAGEDVKALNAELGTLGPVLVGLTSTAVYHTPPLPRGTREAPPQAWAQAVSGDVVCGLLRDDDGGSFVLAANRSVTGPTTAKIRFLRDVRSVERFDRETGGWSPVPMGESGELRADPYDREAMERFMGFTPRDRERMVRLRRLNGYLPPYPAVTLTLAPGDGELLRVR